MARMQYQEGNEKPKVSSFDIYLHKLYKVCLARLIILKRMAPSALPSEFNVSGANTPYKASGTTTPIA